MTEVKIFPLTPITAAEYRQTISEHQLQKEVMNYIEREKATPDIYAFAIPNAGLRSLRMGARMKAEGLRAGMADIGVMLPLGRIAWLEMKSHRGRQSVEQKGFEARCKRLEHPYAVAKTFDEAVMFLKYVGASMTNPFEQLANAQMVAATKRKHKRAEVKIVKSEREAPMKLSEMEQQVADQNKQMRAYRAWKKAEHNAMKHHPTYAAQWAEFTHRVLDLAPDNTNEFISFLKTQVWLRDAEIGIRRLALSFIAKRIIRIRLENGLPPFDDSMPGEEPTAFEIIRKQLRTET